jgi:hypothetical protein
MLRIKPSTSFGCGEPFVKRPGSINNIRLPIPFIKIKKDPRVITNFSIRLIGNHISLKSRCAPK